MKNIIKIFSLILLINLQSIAQTVEETEPNNKKTDAGVIVISSIGNYIGEVTQQYDDGKLEYEDLDYWKLADSSASINFDFSATVNKIKFRLFCYVDANYTNLESYESWLGGDNPSVITLNPERYYIICVFYYEYDYTTTYPYSIIVEDWALPVELTSFYSQINGNTVVLKWNTATEVKNYGFEIERKPENGNWNRIGFVQGMGNSNSPKSYSFTDNDISSGIYLYRLKQIDTDGSYEYSDEIEITVNKPTEFSLLQNFPNPFNPTTKIKYSISSSAKITIKVFDVLGREIKTLLDEYKDTGTYEIEFDGSELTSGLYFYKIISGNKTETRKMMLVR